MTSPMQLDKDGVEAARYAERLAATLHAKHFPEATQWKPLSGDLIGLLTQIDNMTSALSRTKAEAGEPVAWRRKWHGEKRWVLALEPRLVKEDDNEFIQEPLYTAPPAHSGTEATSRIGSWLSAALEDPGVAPEMKEAINEWFDLGEPAPPTHSAIRAEAVLDDSGALARMKKLTVAQFSLAAKVGTLGIDAILADIRELVERAENSVPLSTYESAVKGRAHFRNALREARIRALAPTAGGEGE